MSLPEFRRWAAYRNKRGSLNWGMRIERGFALLSTLYANTHSDKVKYKIYDFMPHESEPELTLEEAIASWG